MLTVRQFIDAKLSPEQWEEIGREIKRPHNKLRELHLSDLTFKNDEFAMFCRCLSDVAEIVLSNLDLSRSQWGAIAKRLSSPDIKKRPWLRRNLFGIGSRTREMVAL